MIKQMLFSNPNYLYIVSPQKNKQKKTNPKNPTKQNKKPTKSTKKKKKRKTSCFLNSIDCFSKTVSIVQEKGWDRKQLVI